MIELTHRDLRLGVDPELGGAVTRLSLAGQDILRPTPADAGDVLQTACFPLVPFANRIANGRFSFAGRDVRLEPNLPGHPHTLHGQGWRGGWAVERQDGASAELVFRYAGGAWPWPYEARQLFQLSDEGVRIRLSAANLADEPAPVGLGLHPYFAGKAGARLQAQVTGAWLTDKLCLATRHVEGLPFADWAAGAPVDTEQTVDHCYSGWDGRARIELPDAGLAVIMTASPELPFLHIFTPVGEDFFCAEPVSHRPDALNTADPEADGVRVLQPGQIFGVEMRLSAEPL